MCPQESSMEGFPCPMAVFLRHPNIWLALPKGMLLFILKLLSTIQVLFCRTTFSFVSSQPLMFQGVIPFQMQEFALALELQEVRVGPSL